MPVYDGSEEALMDTIEKEFSWPQAESTKTKQKGKQGFFWQIPATMEGYINSI